MGLVVILVVLAEREFIFGSFIGLLLASVIPVSSTKFRKVDVFRDPGPESDPPIIRNSRLLKGIEKKDLLEYLTAPVPSCNMSCIRR